jgi:hypothetical protein
VVSLLAALGSVLAAMVAGCSSPANSGVDYSKLGVPVPSPSGSYAKPEPRGKAPGKNANPTEQILYDLQERVVRTAGVSEETKAACEGGVITGTVDQTVGCTVTYRGLTVKYRVEITGGSPTFSWVAATDKGVLAAVGVERAYWAKFGADSSAVRCDKMPSVTLVPLGKDTDFRCYHKGGDGWRQHAVTLKDGGISFTEVSG